MKQLVEQNENYSIFRVDSEELRKVAEFVIKVNYSRHTGSVYPANINEEIDVIYQEELKLAPTSLMFVAENSVGQMIGCIRVVRWDLVNELPMQKIFNINPLDCIDNLKPASSIWHVGRFAVDSDAGISSISLFKQLMVYAITPICQEKDSYMIAECDSKLLRVMGVLGIDATRLGDGIHYLGSETIPICSTRNGLIGFYRKFMSGNGPSNGFEGVMNVA